MVGVGGGGCHAREQTLLSFYFRCLFVAGDNRRTENGHRALRMARHDGHTCKRGAKPRATTLDGVPPLQLGYPGHTWKDADTETDRRPGLSALLHPYEPDVRSVKKRLPRDANHVLRNLLRQHALRQDLCSRVAGPALPQLVYYSHVHRETENTNSNSKTLFSKGCSLRFI